MITPSQFRVRSNNASRLTNSLLVFAILKDSSHHKPHIYCLRRPSDIQACNPASFSFIFSSALYQSTRYDISFVFVYLLHRITFKSCLFPIYRVIVVCPSSIARGFNSVCGVASTQLHIYPCFFAPIKKFVIPFSGIWCVFV